MATSTSKRTATEETPMTTAQRRAVRQALIATGFTRTLYSNVDDNGGYNEYWGNGQGDEVVLAWATASTPDAPAAECTEASAAPANMTDDPAGVGTV